MGFKEGFSFGFGFWLAAIVLSLIPVGIAILLAGSLAAIVGGGK